ncbi:hypothetical protein ABLN87_12995 [Ruegeria sp. SCPT10]|uniref:hypothetical protein n=1 Tax=Ruegeria sp. SCP10 TaxID=3141377 RepID=UPI003337B380
MTKLRISTCDAIVARGEVHIVEHAKEHSVQIKALYGDGERVNLTHEELRQLIDEGTFSIEYGYFASRQVARRASAGRTLIDRLPQTEKWLVFWKELFVRLFLAAEAQNEVSRSEASCIKFIPELHRRVNKQILTDLSKSKIDDGFAVSLSWPAPGRGSLMKWVRVWAPTRDPMTLVRKTIFNGANAKGIDAEREAIIESHLPEFLHVSEISVTQLHLAISGDIRERNKIRKLSDLPPLKDVSESTVRRRVKALDEFEVVAARKGLSVAKNKLGAHSGGLDVRAPLERVEMDEWQIDLMAILAEAGIDFTNDSLRDVEIGRYWICAALDTASRSILGLKLSRQPSSEDAKAVLWMAMRDKSDISKQLGCETNWKQFGHVHHVAVDNGHAFVNVDFKAAVSDLSIGYSVLPAGVPKLRARVERIFLTLAMMLMPYLTGRTFGNPVERGDYPSEKYAVHTAESIIELLVRFIVDVYHVKSHRGLEYASPNDAWDKLCNQFGWSPAPSEHKLRHVLGLDMTRKSGRHGVLVCGINYHSTGLSHHFKKHGSQELDLRIDPENLGHVSIWFDDAWRSVPALIDGVEGVSFASWERTISDVRQKNRAATDINQETIDRAIARMKAIDAEQRAWRRLGPISVSAREIQRAENETFWGLNLKPDPESTEAHLEMSPKSNGGFLSDVISDRTNGKIEPSNESFDVNDDDPVEFWRFSDDDE